MRSRPLVIVHAVLVVAAMLRGADDKAPEAPEKAAPPTCHDRFLALQILNDSIPKNLGTLAGARLKKVQETVDKLIADGESFRKDCADAPEKPWVTYFLAYALNINHLRWYSMLPRDMSAEEKLNARGAYFDRIEALCREILATKDLEKRLRMLAEYQLGQVFHSTGRNEELAKLYEAFAEKYPDYPELDLIYLSIGRAYADAEVWGEAEKWAHRTLEKFPDSRYYPHMGNLLTKVCTGNGKLEQLIEFWEKNEPVFRKRAKDPKTPPEAKPDYDQFADWAKYWVPFAEFALGHFDRARTLYREGREFLLDKKEKEGISQASDVFLGRIDTDLDVVENLVEMPAVPWELDWVSEERPALEDCLGRAVIIVFRSYEWDRVNDALVYLNELYQDAGGPAGPMEVFTVTFYKGMRELDAQREKVRAEARELGLHYGVGIEKGEEKTVHRAYKANVGGSTLVAIDPFGRVIWYKQDPRPFDFGTIRRVIDRITR
ncbi:MAG: hypothetical protein JXP34_28745 [Planctomycetes bacterium]|nr:hypothetical protein [Planctomycetota bacterium]